MLAIFKREIQSFFTSPIGYLIIGLFLTLTGLFLWVFSGSFNILEYGFADLSHFFNLTPWVFLFLIPAITMRSFSEEKKLGTLELLYIKPIGLTNIVLGKFLGTFTLSVIALIPTLLYVYTISELGVVAGNLDSGIVIGSYFGVLFLVAAYTAIGIFTSTLSENQIIAFILGVALCFMFYYGFESMSTLFEGSTASFIKKLGIKTHFDGVSQGIVDTRSIVYFASITLFFVFLTTVQLKNATR